MEGQARPPPPGGDGHGVFDAPFPQFGTMQGALQVTIIVVFM